MSFAALSARAKFQVTVSTVCERRLVARYPPHAQEGLCGFECQCGSLPFSSPPLAESSCGSLPYSALALGSESCLPNMLMYIVPRSKLAC